MEIKVIKKKITKEELEGFAKNNYGDMIKDKWHKLSLAEQMGNIGSEVFRLINSKERGDLNNAQSSFVRVLGLIDLTIGDKRWKGRLFEVLRLREVICNFYLDKKIYNISIDNLKKYFIPFALISKLT